MREMLLLSIIPILQVERLGHKEMLQITLVLSDSAMIQNQAEPRQTTMVYGL